MNHKVKVSPTVRAVQLTRWILASANQEVVLTDAQYAALDPTTLGTDVLDLGPTTDPATNTESTHGDTIVEGGTVGPAGAPGLSAYDLAVMNGYSGTQAQWLASLHGQDGVSTTSDGTVVTPQHFTFVQQMPSDTWVIDHHLGYVPSVMVVDTQGTAVTGDVEVTSTAQLVVSFAYPFAGTAYLS